MEKKNISRRSFVKKAGIGSAILGAAALSGGIISCKSKKKETVESGPLGPIPTDKMTYRTNPKTGEKVSLLGYGCMRIPSIDNTSTSYTINVPQVNRDTGTWQTAQPIQTKSQELAR